MLLGSGVGAGVGVSGLGGVIVGAGVAGGVFVGAGVFFDELIFFDDWTVTLHFNVVFFLPFLIRQVITAFPRFTPVILQPYFPLAFTFAIFFLLLFQLIFALAAMSLFYRFLR